MGVHRLAAGPSGVVPTAVADRYLARQPTLGPATVIDIRNESADRKLLAATLQGVVNRTEARIYLVGARGPSEDQHWLDVYTSRGLINITATVDLNAALQQFKSELAGYVLATDAEPWTINTATSVAGATGGVVATPNTVGVLQAEGLTQIADHRGTWTDAATAYAAIADQYRGSLAYQGVAIQQADRHQPRDLYVQQGILTLYTRPSQADFDRVYRIIETFPAARPVYGYVADDGVEEVQAVARLAQTGRFLVPTDTTDNLSFHIAVGGAQRELPPPVPADVAQCTADTVNVTISFSDGDNMVIPESYYPRSNYWGSSRRGELPMGWGISPSAAVLMPAIWDSYVADVGSADEIVDIMGLGYSIPSLMPDGGTSFLADGMRMRSALGLTSTWSLDGLLSNPTAPGWNGVHAATEATGSPPAGLLLNYTKWPGPAIFHTSDDTPVLASQQSSYEAGPADIAAQIEALVVSDPNERPLVSFIPATVWESSYDALADALAPLQEQGVRFLTPAEAFACLPRSAVPPTTESSTTTTGSTTPAPEQPGSGAATAAPGASPARPVATTANYVG